MAELLKTGLDFLHDTLKAHDSRTVTLQRGVLTGSVTAVVRTTSYELDDGQNTITVKGRDFVIQVADYIIDGTLTTPARGDQVIDDGVTYELMTKGAKPHVSQDPYGKAYRIHTTEVA